MASRRVGEVLTRSCTTVVLCATPAEEGGGGGGDVTLRRGDNWRNDVSGVAVGGVADDGMVVVGGGAADATLRAESSFRSGAEGSLSDEVRMRPYGCGGCGWARCDGEGRSLVFETGALALGLAVPLVGRSKRGSRGNVSDTDTGAAVMSCCVVSAPPS